MFLKKITLTNFRQFYGTQELLIAGHLEKNVTLIHAENGVGKTTILNAILWCFYEETTLRFEQPEKIANHQAVSEGNYSYKIEVAFDNNSEEYLVTREGNERTKESDFKAFLVKNGNYTALPNPTAFVNSVVPLEMAKYFFFDGEYAEAFSSQKNKSKVREALEDMLGCRTANAGIKDILYLKNTIESEIAALTKNNFTETFQTNIDSLTLKNENDQAELLRHEENLTSAESARDEIIEKLRGAVAASKIQQKRESYQKEHSRLLAGKLKQEKEFTDWINDGGIGLIAKQLEEKTQTVLESAQAKGKIPSYIADTFVNDILHSKLCICDRSFEDLSKEANAISKLLQDAGTSLASDRLLNARALMAKLSEKRSKSLINYDRIKESIEYSITEINSVELKIEECSAELRGSNIQEIAAREVALEARYVEITGLNNKISRIRFDCELRTKEIESYKLKRNKSLQTNTRAIALQKRLELLEKTSIRIQKELEKYREESRNAIAADINEILEETARREYVATIDERFNLEMYYKNSKDPVARSSGENQLLSLAFIAALIKFSAKRMESISDILKPGASAPLVLDSPFGQLDPTYQKATSKFLPLMATQVILLVSRAQGNSEVINMLKDKIGHEYILVSENTVAQGEKPSDIININGNEIACSRYGCEKTFTRIEAV